MVGFYILRTIVLYFHMASEIANSDIPTSFIATTKKEIFDKRPPMQQRLGQSIPR